MRFKGGAGLLNRRIDFHRMPNANTDATDSYGETITEPTTIISNVMCVYESVGGIEFPAAMKRNSESDARFRIRYRHDIDPRTAPGTLQITYIEDHTQSPAVVRTFDIKHVDVIRRDELRIEVKEIL